MNEFRESKIEVLRETSGIIQGKAAVESLGTKTKSPEAEEVFR